MKSPHMLLLKLSLKWRIKYSPFLCIIFFLLGQKIYGHPKLNPKLDLQVYKNKYDNFLEKADEYYWQGTEEALIYIDSARNLAMFQEMWSDYIKATFQRIAHNFIYKDLRDTKEILVKLDSLEVQPNLTSIDNDLWIQKLSYWGEYYRHLGYFEKSLEYFEQCLDKWKNHTGISETQRCKEVFRVNLFIAQLYSFLGRYEEALSHYFGNYAYFECFQEVDLESASPSYFATTYKLIGDVYFDKGDKKKAMIFYGKALKDLEAIMANPQNRDKYSTWAKSIYRAMAKAHMDNPKIARDYLDKIISLQKQDDDPVWINIFRTSSDIFLKEANYDGAISEMKKALSLSQKRYGEKFYNTATYYLYLGKIYHRNGDHQLALNQFQQALKSFSIGFNKDNLSNLPVIDSIYAKKEVLEVLKERLKTLLEIFKKNKDPQYLQLAKNTSTLSIQLIDQTRESFWLDRDKERLVDLSFELYELAVELYFLVGNYTEAFKISEKSKALTLLEAIRKESNSWDKDSYPNWDLFEEEKEIQYKIIFSEKEFHLERTQKNPNTKKLSKIVESLGELRIKSVHIKNQLAKYRNDMNLESQEEFFNVEMVQRKLIRDDQTLLEFFTGKRYTYLFVINKNHFDAQKINSGEESKKEIEQYLEGLNGYFLSTNPTDSLYQANNKKLILASWSMYQKFLGSVEEKLKENLIIIPDGLLNYIPFEALLTNPIDGNTQNFQTLPYLLNKHRISYSYSANLLAEMNKSKPLGSLRLIAFAPSFPSQLPQNKLLASRRLRGNALDTLYHNVKEVNSLEKLYPGSSIYTHQKATRSNFIHNAPAFSLIHIATHGVVNDSSSNFSFLAFTNVGDSVENKLFVQDLYALRLKAALVVISACDTGIGELRKGEGLISIARGFSYAGASSILTSLWSVNDSATAQIIQSYYQFLKEGASKPSALRQAKLAFISGQKDASEAHPFFWASFIQIGNREPIGTPWGVFELIIGILLVIILGILIGLYSKRKRQLKS